MKKHFLAFIGIILINFSIFAQNEKFSSDSLITKKFHRNIFLELLGPAAIGSFNYDMRLERGKQDGIGFRSGFSYFYVGGVGSNINTNINAIFIPLEMNYLFGKKRSSLVIGFGTTLAFISGEINYNRYNIREKAVGFGNVFGNIGYRYQPIGKGFFGQFNLYPNYGTSIGIYPGLSFGYGFKK